MRSRGVAQTTRPITPVAPAYACSMPRSGLCLGRSFEGLDSTLQVSRCDAKAHLSPVGQSAFRFLNPAVANADQALGNLFVVACCTVPPSAVPTMSQRNGHRSLFSRAPTGQQAGNFRLDRQMSSKVDPNQFQRRPLVWRTRCNCRSALDRSYYSSANSAKRGRKSHASDPSMLKLNASRSMQSPPTYWCLDSLSHAEVAFDETSAHEVLHLVARTRLEDFDANALQRPTRSAGGLKATALALRRMDSVTDKGSLLSASFQSKKSNMMEQAKHPLSDIISFSLSTRFLLSRTLRCNDQMFSDWPSAQFRRSR